MAIGLADDRYLSKYRLCSLVALENSAAFRLDHILEMPDTDGFEAVFRSTLFPRKATGWVAPQPDDIRVPFKSDTPDDELVKTILVMLKMRDGLGQG